MCLVFLFQWTRFFKMEYFGPIVLIQWVENPNIPSYQQNDPHFYEKMNLFEIINNYLPD